MTATVRPRRAYFSAVRQLFYVGCCWSARSGLCPGRGGEPREIEGPTRWRWLLRTEDGEPLAPTW